MLFGFHVTASVVVNDGAEGARDRPVSLAAERRRLGLDTITPGLG